MSHTLHLGNVAIETDLQPDLSAIRCDGSQIQQVVMNLVLNGAEAIPVSKGGIVRVSTREDIGSQSVVLDVEDTGEGIPPENVEKIFDPFFTTKEEGKGVGLGLAVVYGVVHAHGGDIEVTSVVGRGTTFHVSLPLNSKPGSVGRDSGNETGLFV